MRFLSVAVLPALAFSLATTTNADAVTWTQQQKIVASDAALSDRLGAAVAVSGDTAVVGAWGKSSNRGAAYVFVRNNGVWALQQELLANNGVASDVFGWTVAVSGNTAVIGAPGYGTYQGAAYVFVRNGSTWNQEALLNSPDGTPNQQFGYSVAVSGETAVIGSISYAGHGVGYVFVRSDGIWTVQQKLTASDAASNDLFGYSVSMSGSSAVFAAPGKNANRGAAYVFVRSGAVWTEQQELTAADGAAADWFGVSASISGDVLAIGAFGKNGSQGTAYVFGRSSGAWSQQQQLTASDGAAGDGFGYSVSISADMLAIGAPTQAGNQGTAYVFSHSGPLWGLPQKLVAADGAANDHFGESVSVNGQTVLSGARGNNGDRGAAYAFTGPKLGTSALLLGSAGGTSSVVLSTSGAWTASVNDAFLHLTSSASGIGNGLIVFTYDPYTGLGQRTGTLTIAGLTVTVTQAGPAYIGPGPVFTLVSSGLALPGGLDMDAAGNVYIAEIGAYGASTIKEWNPATQQMTTLVSSGLSHANGVAVDSDGNLYIAEYSDNVIKEWNVFNRQLSTLVSAGLTGPGGMAVDAAGNVYITNVDSIKEWIASTQALTTLVPSGLRDPWDVALDAAGNVYIADLDNSAVKEWDAVTHLVIQRVSSGLSGPAGVAVDGSGNIYIVDNNNNNIKEWNASTGQVTTLASGLNGPQGVTVDGSGNVYFADTLNNAFKEIPYAFVGPASFTEPAASGSDSLLPVIPRTTSLTGVFASSSDQTWLTIGPIVNGVIGFSFSANYTMSTRTAHLKVLGHQITVTQNGLSAQTITFNTLFNQIFGVSVPLSATSSSGLTVSFNSQTTSVCTVSGTTVTLVSLGTCTIQATQDGNGNYAAATPVSRSFQVTQGSQTIAFGSLSNQPFGSAPFTLSATATSGLAVNFASTTPSICTVAVALVTLVSIGACSIQATQIGNTNYAAATPVSQTFQVTQAGLWLQQQKLTAADGKPGDWSGYSVSISGDTAVIGSMMQNSNQGAAYVMVRNSGVWTQQQKLTASDGAANDFFGQTVSVSGDTAVVGAYGKNAIQGAAYVFVRSGGVWTQQQELTASDGAAGDKFGFSVSASGETAVIGAHFKNGNQGAAYVFVRNSGVWSLQQKLTASDGTTNDWFGESVSLTGDTAAIGADRKNNYQGAAYIFVRSGTVWSQQQKLTASDGAAGDWFGNTVSVNGDTAVAGAFYKNGYQGAAYVFVRSGTVWSQQQELTASDGAASDYFGNSVAVYGDMAAIAAYGKSGNQGAVYMFARSAGAWGLHQKLTASDATAADEFGASVSLSGATALIGTPCKLTCQGAAYAMVGPVLGANTLLTGSGAGSSSVIVAAGGSWTAVSNNSFLHIAGGTASGTGNGLVTFTYDPFTGTGTRAGTLTIAGLLFTMTQAGTNYLGPGPVNTLVSTGLIGPRGIAADSSGNIYIADSGHTAIKEWSPATQQVTTLVSSGLSGTVGVAVDYAGSVYIVDGAGNAIKKWNPATQQLTTVVSSGLNSPSGVALDFAGNIYIADTLNHAVKKWIAATQQLSTLVSSGLSSPNGVAVDIAGNVYIADYGDSTIKRWTASSQQLTTLVSSGLNQPLGVAVDGAGNVYIADTNNNAIKQWSPSTQQMTTLAPAGLSVPAAVALDGAGNIYIADWANNAIKEFSNTFAGPPALTEPSAAGSDTLLPVLPSTTPLNGIFAPASDQGWLTVGPIVNGTIGFSFASNPAQSPRTAHLTVLGRQITVTQGTQTAQTISFASLSNQMFGNAPFTISATASSGLTVSFGSLTTAVCTVSGATVTVISIGTCTIQATQAGDATFAAAPAVNQSFQVTPGAPKAISVSTGSGQSVMIGMPFANPLQALVVDGGGNPVPNTVVTFTAPSSGPSGTFANGLVTYTASTNASGIASSTTFTANANGGTYSVTAMVMGVSIGASFSMTNLNAAALTLAKTHTGDFVLGQSGATYTVTVGNMAGAGSTSGVVTMTEMVPGGMTLKSMNGGATWNCTVLPFCTTSTVLNGGSTYPAITVTVDVPANASSPQLNTVTVSGGGSALAGATDSTVIITPVTIQTNPAGLQFTVDGGAVLTAPQTLNLSQVSHTIAVMATQPGSTGTQYVFTGWSDSGAASHTITVGGSAATYTASFKTQYQLTISASPAAGGIVTPGNAFFDAGAVEPISGVANSGYSFTSWSGGGVANPSSASTTVTINAPETVTANFSSLTGITIQTSPPGLLFTMDGGAAQMAPQTLNLSLGSHTMAVATVQAGSAGTQYILTGWSDSGAASHSIAVGSAAATYTATFKTQYLLTISASPAAGGTVTPVSGGFYDSGASVPVVATPNAGYVFVNWSGPVAVTTNASTTVTMSATQTVTANFSAMAGITIQTNPPGLQFTVDGGAVQTAPQTINLTQGTHSIGVATTQASGSGTQYIFTAWSDGGAASHSITVGSTPATYTASFKTQYRLTIAASPVAGGTVTPASGAFYDSGTVVPIAAAANAGYGFVSWTGPVAAINDASTTVTMSAAQAVTANFTSSTGITIQTNPTGLQFSVDGGAIQTAPQTLSLAPGSHIIGVPTTQMAGSATQYTFTSWSDSGAASHSITVGASAATYTASFKTQYQLTMSASPAVGGAVTPSAGGFYDSNAVVPIGATANTGYSFNGWNGGVTNPASASTTVTMTAPKTVTANFTYNGIPFLAGSVDVGSGIQYLTFPNGVPFGYFVFLSGGWIFHADLGYEFVAPETGGTGVFFWDMATGHWLYTNRQTFPYLYDFTLNVFLYYFPDTQSAGHYLTNPRVFANMTTGAIFAM